MEGAEGGIGIGFDLGEANYLSKSFSVSGQVTAVGEAEVVFSSDGTRMFVLSYSDDKIFQYSLSTAWDVTTASYDSISLSVSSSETAPLALAISSDDTNLYIAGPAVQYIFQYTMTTAKDLSTASYAGKILNVSGQETNPRGLSFSADGSKFYLVGINSDKVHQYNLSTPWDISTGSYTEKIMQVLYQEGNPCGLAISSDGTKVFIVGTDNDTIYQYNLSTAYDVSTGSYSGLSFSVAAQDGTPRGITFSPDGIYMYIVGQSNRSVYQYKTEQLGFINQMDKTQLDAVTDPNHIALGNDLDLAIIFNMTSGTTVPSSDGVAINYDANVLNKGAVLGTDYDFDAPAQDKVRITALAGNNLKVRVV
jgi:sugar lactone lactonase YvrE